MEYRVFDTERQQWINKNIYLSPDGELLAVKRFLFGIFKVFRILPQDRYIYHKAIDLWDKNQKQVYEGDYILAQIAEDKSVVGLVAFATELSSYVILCVDSDEFYTLGSQVCDYIEVIGNVFDGYKEEKEDGQQAL